MKKGKFIVTFSSILLCGLLSINNKAVKLNAEYADCWYEHDHVELTGYSTGDTYYGEKGFGSNVCYEAVKLIEGEEYIEVDGFRDDVWDSAYVIDTFIPVENAGNNRGTEIKASYMWDSENLYVWAEIYDSTYVLSWDNGTDWAAWGDYCELYVDTLHNSSLASDSWNGSDGSEYRGKNPNSGCWPDGSEYEDCCFGQFKCSAGFKQSLERTDPDSKYGRGGAVQWQMWTWLSAACQEDDCSLFTSAFIYDGIDVSEPYDRTYQTKGGIQNGAELGLGRPIGYTFEAQINFKSSDYMPEDYSIIGAGLRIADMTDISWWGDMGGDYCIYAQESQAGGMWSAPKNLPNLVLLPADESSSGSGEVPIYNATFTVDGEVVKSIDVPKNTIIEAPEDPYKEGYTFTGWKGFSSDYKLRSNKTFVAEFVKRMDHLPDYPSKLQSFSNYVELPDGYSVTVFEAEKTSALIEVDGVMDDAYLEAVPIKVDELMEGDSGVTGFAYIVWDENYIYAYVVVEDDFVSTNVNSSQPFFSDSVEFVIDTYNKANGEQQHYGDTYRGNDYVGEGQFRLNAGQNTLTGRHWMFDNADVKKYAASRIIDGEGYSAEYKIEWASFKNKVDVGEQIAFAIVINDGEGTNRNGIVAVDYGQNHAFEWVGVLSKLDLIDNQETVIVEPQPIIDPEVSEDISEEPKNSEDNPVDPSPSKKGCKGLAVPSLMSLFALAGLLLSKKRK